MESNIGRLRNLPLSTESGVPTVNNSGDLTAMTPVNAATHALPLPPTVVPPSMLVTGTRLPAPASEHGSMPERATQVAHPPENAELHADIVSAIVQQVNGANVATSTLDKAKMLTQWQRISKAFRNEIQLSLQQPAMAEVGRRAMANTIAHLANRGNLDRAGLQKAVDRVLQNKQHVGINLATINNAEHRGVVLDVLERLADLRKDKPLLSLEVQTPMMYGSVPRLLQVLETVDASNAELGDFHLNMERNGLGDADAAKLSKLQKLTSLGLFLNRFTAQGAAHLVTLPRLTTLNVRQNALGDEGAKILAGHPALATLNISKNKLTIEGLRHLAANTVLVRLDLGGDRIGTEEAEVLSAMHSLKYLGVEDSKIPLEGVEKLSGMRNLTGLDVSSNKLTDKVAVVLESFGRLEEVRVGGNDMSAEGALSIAKMNSVKTLDIATNPIREGGKALVSMPNLTSLSAWMCELGFDTAKELAEQPRLTHLDIRDNGLSAADKTILKAGAKASDVVL